MTRTLIKDFELACKIAVFIFAISVGMVALLAGTKAALAATLRGDGVITGEYIRLGDIFDGVKNADYVLGPAPLPGKDMILNARTLYKIASALDVDWQPASSTEQIIIKREASIVPVSDITEAIEKKIKDTGTDGKFSLTYNNTPADIVLPGNESPALEISAFNFNPDKDTFNAVIVSPSIDNPLKRISLAGHIERLVSIPVFKSSLRNGDIISANDLDWIDMPQSKITDSIVTKDSDLINMTPRRTAIAGKPVMLNDLEPPKMVDRGDSVTLVFENGPMVLTTKGKALQDGSMGDTIRVSNTDSNKNLQGVVTANREVTIR